MARLYFGTAVQAQWLAAVQTLWPKAVLQPEPGEDEGDTFLTLRLYEEQPAGVRYDLTIAADDDHSVRLYCDGSGSFTDPDLPCQISVSCCHANSVQETQLHCCWPDLFDDATRHALLVRLYRQAEREKLWQ